jgi:hypothetical protein
MSCPTHRQTKRSNYLTSTRERLKAVQAELAKALTARQQPLRPQPCPLSLVNPHSTTWKPRTLIAQLGSPPASRLGARTSMPPQPAGPTLTAAHLLSPPLATLVMASPAQRLPRCPSSVWAVSCQPGPPTPALRLQALSLGTYLRCLWTRSWRKRPRRQVAAQPEARLVGLLARGWATSSPPCKTTHRCAPPASSPHPLRYRSNSSIPQV